MKRPLKIALRLRADRHSGTCSGWKRLGAAPRLRLCPGAPQANDFPLAYGAPAMSYGVGPGRWAAEMTMGSENLFV